ncbi:MAG: M23 family metallopeptidase [Parasporobacterium sp.]|nr:M23 family metallopeptidase [Parasporobacterium sp.]
MNTAKKKIRRSLLVLAVILVLICTGCDVPWSSRTPEPENPKISLERTDEEKQNSGEEPITAPEETIDAPQEDDRQEDASQDITQAPTEYWNLKAKVARGGELGTEYPVLSYYGYRDDFNGQISSYHRGIDFDMPVGTELLAPDNCEVVYTGFQQQRGYWIVMYWGDGYYIVYQHLSQILVKPGMYLTKGTPVAFSGDTGASLMPHLHLEVLQSYDGTESIVDFNANEYRIDPYYFVF